MAKTAGAFAVDDRVNHSGYGTGKITGVNAQHTTIDFDSVGIKKFLTSIVRLEHSDTPAPVKKRASAAKAAKKS